MHSGLCLSSVHKRDSTQESNYLLKNKKNSLTRPGCSGIIGLVEAHDKCTRKKNRRKKKNPQDGSLSVRPMLW